MPTEADLDEKIYNARLMLSSFPDLNRWLMESGAGNDYRMVKKLIAAAESNRGSARIKNFVKMYTRD